MNFKTKTNKLIAIYFTVRPSQVLSRGILVVLPLDGILMLSHAMASIVPGLPVVLRQDVDGSVHLTGDVVLHTRPGEGGAFQPRLTGPAPLRSQT